MQFEIVILAGGLSTRMGRDKSRLRLGGVTMLERIRNAARATGLPVRVVRHDLVGRCGPLGGLFTALKTTRADAVICLACDMPLVSTQLLEDIALRARHASGPAVCSVAGGRRGFPMVLSRQALEAVEAQLLRGEHSLQQLLDHLGAEEWMLPEGEADCLFNVNTVEDLERVRAHMKGATQLRPHLRSSAAGQS